ncbi:MAG TPA: hypothetical protein VFX89_19385 [Gammaproteobacteria bacterium]|nr:hypothetical protein [Gammaproteobacteria bacterium]
MSLAPITSANAPAIAGAVLSASFDGSSLGSFAGFGAGGASPLAGTATAPQSKAAQIQRAHVLAVVKQSAARTAQATFDPEMSQCTGGGTVTVSGNLANPLTLSPNDTILFVFASCAEDGATVSGRFAMRVTSFSGDLLNGAFTLGVSVDLTSFAVTADGETATANGTIAIAVSSSFAGTVSTTVTSSSFTIADGTTTVTLSDYSAARTLDTVAGSFTLDAGGTVTSSAFSGSVTFDTTLLLTGTGDSFASAGELVITGANKGTIKVAVLDETSVRISVDANGDGTVDTIVDQTWEELL